VNIVFSHEQLLYDDKDKAENDHAQDELHERAKWRSETKSILETNRQSYHVIVLRFSQTVNFNLAEAALTLHNKSDGAM